MQLSSSTQTSSSVSTPSVPNAAARAASVPRPTRRTEAQHDESLPEEATLKTAIKDMYRRVSEEPEAEFHFKLGRQLTEELGYPAELLDRIPAQALESFAGVGYHFDLAELSAGDHVLDLGSGSGTDAFCAARLVGPTGRVTGIDMTDAQLAKSRRLAATDPDLSRVEFVRGYIEDLSAETGSYDCVVSNGVINLVADKHAVFAEAARILRVGGKLAISDIVTQKRLPADVTCNAELWAACIGGAMHRGDYLDAIEEAGLSVQFVRMNNYTFLPGRAQRSADKYGVVSLSLIAVKK